MFSEQNSVENYIRDLLAGKPIQAVAEGQASYGGQPITRAARGMGWHFVPGPQLARQTTDVMVEADVKAALIRLNPEIGQNPDFADEVIYRLRAIVQSVRDDGLVRSNEKFMGWLRGEMSMPFGPNQEHVSIRLLDFENPASNYLVASTQVTFVQGVEKRFDLVLFVNGFPLVVGECKSPTRPAVSWVDAADDVHNDYEKTVSAFFVPNVFSFGTEGKTYRYGSIGLPLEHWAPWREDGSDIKTGLNEVQEAVQSMLRPETVLDILEHFTLFATGKKKQKIKMICRFQQYHAVNGIVDRVVQGRVRKGLIWHFQGSGKSLLMVFAAQKLRKQASLGAPTVMIVVDRIDLDAQITATFNATDVPNVEPAETRSKLMELLKADTRKVIITTIHKFGEAEGVLNDRGNIICMVDECHRTQEGDLGRKMRQALPNAFLFGLTGTPINKRDRNTFWAFGSEEDESGYMSRYRFDESIRDGATLKLHFEPRLIDLRIDRKTIDEEFRTIGSDLSESDLANLSKQAGRMAHLMKAPNRVKAIAADIARHYQEKVEQNGFKAQVVVYDQESCLLMKEALDELLPPDWSEVVISVGAGEADPRLTKCRRDRDQEEQILDRFRDPQDPLKLIIVTAKLLTGFDAPILQVQYLDKLLKEHTLLQAICRTNRTYPGKSHGLIVDYIGVFDDIQAALDFDDKSVQTVVSNISELKAKLPGFLAKCLGFFEGVDRTVAGYEGLVSAQQCLPNNEVRDDFASAFSALSQCWETLSPDPFLTEFTADYEWLAKVYESVQPPSGNGKLVWHRLGAKTLELIHRNIHVDAVRTDLDELVLDQEVLESILLQDDPKKRKEIEIQIVERLRKHANHPKFIALGQRLEDLKEKFEKGLMHSIQFLKELLQIAQEVVNAEKEEAAIDPTVQGKAALTDLFQSVKTEQTPVIVERVVNDIDEIVRQVRFPGWQATNAGERQVKQSLRRALLKYQLHHDNELFDKAYDYVKTYYAI